MSVATIHRHVPFSGPAAGQPSDAGRSGAPGRDAAGGSLRGGTPPGAGQGAGPVAGVETARADTSRPAGVRDVRRTLRPGPSLLMLGSPVRLAGAAAVAAGLWLALAVLT